MNANTFASTFAFAHFYFFNGRAKSKELASHRTQTAMRTEKISVDNFAFTSSLVSADSNFADRQIKKIIADRRS